MGKTLEILYGTSSLLRDAHPTPTPPHPHHPRNLSCGHKNTLNWDGHRIVQRCWAAWRLLEPAILPPWVPTDVPGGLYICSKPGAALSARPGPSGPLRQRSQWGAPARCLWTSHHAHNPSPRPQPCAPPITFRPPTALCSAYNPSPRPQPCAPPITLRPPHSPMLPQPPEWHPRVAKGQYCSIYVKTQGVIKVPWSWSSSIQGPVTRIPDSNDLNGIFTLPGREH